MTKVISIDEMEIEFEKQKSDLIYQNQDQIMESDA